MYFLQTPSHSLNFSSPHWFSSCFLLLLKLLPQALFQDRVLILQTGSVLQTTWQFKVRTLLLKKKLNVSINSRLGSLQPWGTWATPSFPRTQPSFLLLPEISNNEHMNVQIIPPKIIKNNFAEGCNSTSDTFLSSTVIFCPCDEGLKYVQ